MSLTGIGDTIADTLEAMAAKSLEAALIAELPFLGWPFFSPILDWLVNRELTKIKTDMEVLTYLLYSHAIVNNEVGTLADAAAGKIKADASGDPDAIAKANQAIIAAARKLGSLNNVN